MDKSKLRKIHKAAVTDGIVKAPFRQWIQNALKGPVCPWMKTCFLLGWGNVDSVDLENALK